MFLSLTFTGFHNRPHSLWFSLRRSRPSHRLDRLSVNSCTIARIGIQKSHKDLISGFLSGCLCTSRLAQFLSVCEGWTQSDVKIHNERLQQREQTMKEQFELESPRLNNKKIALREFLQGQNVFVNFPTGLLASCNHRRCMRTAAYSAI